MNTSQSPPPPHARRREGFTEQDVCNYAHHLWVESGMSFTGDPWAEARACLEANLPPAPASLARRTTRRTSRHQEPALTWFAPGRTAAPPNPPP